MSVSFGDNVIHLAGRCLAEDAEALLAVMLENPGAVVDVSGAQKLHLALVQILLAACPVVQGAASNTNLPRHLTDLLQ